jgi:hypothetical protein
MAGNPPSSRLVTIRYGQLQSLGQGGLTTQGAPALNTIDYEAKLPTTTQYSGGIQMVVPFDLTLDVEYVGHYAFNTVRTVNINSVDLGSAFLPQNQNPNLVSATPGGAALSNDAMRPYRGYAAINMRQFNGWRKFDSIQTSIQRRFRNGMSFGFNDTWVLRDHASVAPRLQHAADGSYSVRADQDQAQKLLGETIPIKHHFKGNFVWDLPDLRKDGAALKTLGMLINDWQLSGVWTATTGSAYSVAYSYTSGGTNVNITGSNDFGGRVRIVGDPGSGCSSDIYRQFNAAAFQGPLTNSDGLESGAGYLRGCFTQVLDMSIARNIRMGGARNLQLRVDMFNAPNSAGIIARQTSMTLASPADPVTVSNLPYDASGNILSNRVRPNQAGFGAVSNWQAPRQVQVQVKFSF